MLKPSKANNMWETSNVSRLRIIWSWGKTKMGTGSKQSWLFSVAVIPYYNVVVEKSPSHIHHLFSVYVVWDKQVKSSLSLFLHRWRKQNQDTKNYRYAQGRKTWTEARTKASDYKFSVLSMQLGHTLQQIWRDGQELWNHYSLCYKSSSPKESIKKDYLPFLDLIKIASSLFL